MTKRFLIGGAMVLVFLAAVATLALAEVRSDYKDGQLIFYDSVTSLTNMTFSSNGVLRLNIGGTYVTATADNLNSGVASSGATLVSNVNLKAFGSNFVGVAGGSLLEHGNAMIGGTLISQGALLASNTVRAIGAVTADSTLIAQGTLTSSGAVHSIGRADFDGIVKIQGAATASNTLAVLGVTTLTGNLIANGASNSFANVPIYNDTLEAGTLCYTGATKTLMIR